MPTISKSTLQFLKNLKNNNNKEWFESNKTSYEMAKKEFEIFITALVSEIIKFDVSLTGIVPSKLIFRIYRDVRFSKDKSPYKSNMGAYLVAGGKQGMMTTAGYYIHIEPGKSFLAGGAYQPPAPWIKSIRNAIDEHGKEFYKIITSKSFTNFLIYEGEALSKVPQGYDKDHPYAELLKKKSHLAMSTLKDSEILSTDFLKHCSLCFKAMKPMNDFLNGK